MAEKSFGVKEINLIGASGTPTIESPNNLNLNAVNVAISTNVSIGGTLTVTGNVSVGGTLTYEDVTNIDSVGIITARSDIKVGTGVTITSAGAGFYAGIVTASNFVKIDGSSMGGFSPDAQGNLVAGTSAGANFSGTDANHNILIGYEAGNALTTADNNVAIGFEALKSADTEGGNVAIGYRAMKEMTGFGGNVCIGYEAGYYTYGLWDCVAIGKDAMQKPVQSGYTAWSVAVGVEAMAACGASKCVAIGYEALHGNNATSAEDNTAVGYQSLTSVLSNGLKNTAVGSLSGKATTSGDENVYIGYNAGNNAHATGSNCIIIGNNSAASSTSVSNEITLGDANITKFRIPGIDVVLKDNGGTPTEGHVLTVDGSGEASFVGVAVTEAPAADYTITSPTGSYYIFHGGGVDETLQNPTLYLKRGQKYRFNNTTGSSHPFEFRNEANNADYTEGITGSQNGVQFFTVPQGAPAVLRYRCTIHTGSMQGLIYIIDRGRFPQLSKSSNYVIVADDAGKHIKNTSGGWTVNTSTSFEVGDVARVVNASGSSQTVFQASGVTIYSRRDGGVSGDHSIVARGMATLLCTGTNEYYISGDI